MSSGRKRATLAMCMLAVAGCMRSGGSPMGIPLREITRFDAEWNDYLRLSPRKALAVAGDRSGVYVSGFAHAYPIQALANDEALERCEERRLDLRIDSECRLYAVGDQLVEDAGAE